MLGKKLSELNLKAKSIPYFGVKEAVFPFNMFPEVDPLLGPEMRSTGEVLGMADSFGLAFYKAQKAANQTLPSTGVVLITIIDADKSAGLEVAKRQKTDKSSGKSEGGISRWHGSNGSTHCTVAGYFHPRGYEI